MTDSPSRQSFVTAENVALLVDQYELTMMQAYVDEEMFDPATFSLYIRTLPESRNYFLAAGLDDALRYLEEVEFTDNALDYLSTFDEFHSDFLDWLADFEFTGDVRALPEGTPFFNDEPLLEVTGPLPEAQLAETFIMNQVHVQTMLASKASRVVRAAGDTPVVDFGLRRMHGADAGLKSARAFHIAGCAATSNVLAGKVYEDVQVTGTMAHSYVQSHSTERDAFRKFSEQYPDTILLVDTYDTLDGVRNVIELAEEQGDNFDVRGIRLDSGNLGELAKEARSLLDDAGLDDVNIFASGGLDEWKITELRKSEAPIDGYGVGTRMGVSRDMPAGDMVYKLTEYAGEGRLKLSKGKRILPGSKQVFRIEENGKTKRDVIAGSEATIDGRPLLKTVMKNGNETGLISNQIDDARERAEEELDALPNRIQSIEPADPPYPVEISPALKKRQEEVAERVEQSMNG